MEPIKGNALSKSCGEIISSNCVTIPIAIAGVCGPIPTLTQVLVALNNCCNSTTDSPCYTGSWLDFSTSIPTSGATTGVGTWTIGTFGVGNTGDPSYKWTKEGDIVLRGGLVLNFSPSINKTYIDIPLFTFPSATCFPSVFTHNQGVVTFVDFFISSNQVISTRAVVYIDAVTKTLFLNFTWGNIPLIAMRCEIDLGGVRFNLS